MGTVIAIYFDPGVVLSLGKSWSHPPWCLSLPDFKSWMGTCSDDRPEEQARINPKTAVSISPIDICRIYLGPKSFPGLNFSNQCKNVSPKKKPGLKKKNLAHPPTCGALNVLFSLTWQRGVPPASPRLSTNPPAIEP